MRMICDVCGQESIPSLISIYRRECRPCRAARRSLKRAGVTHRAIKQYLETIGLDPAMSDPISAEVCVTSSLDTTTTPTVANTIDFETARLQSGRKGDRQPQGA